MDDHIVGESALDWERPWERSGRRRDETAFDPEVVRQLGERLERFATDLEPDERASLLSLLDASMVDRPLRELAAVPAEQVLTLDELALFRTLADEPIPSRGSLRASLHVVMKATRLCNLRCTYCNYWREGPDQVMTDRKSTRLNSSHT